MTREQELSAAIEKAALPARDYRIFSALLRQRAEWKTATIPAKFQPRGLADLARLAQTSKANLCRGLDHLESHGWIQRNRADKHGRGHRTTYQLTAGMSCDCLKPKQEPMTDAERMRRYRARKRATATGPEVSQDRVTLAPESVSEPRNEVSQNDVTKCLSERNEIPGQGQFPAKEGRSEGSSKRGRLCAVCETPLDPVLSEHGYQTHPECDEAEETPGWPAPAEGQFFGTLAEMNRSTDASRGRAA